MIQINAVGGWDVKVVAGQGVARTMETAGGCVMINSSTGQAGVVTQAWQWLSRHLGPVDELTRLSQDDLRLMASDLGLSEQELHDAASSDLDITPELHAMMQGVGLDPAEVQHRFGAIMRDIQVTCVRCTNRRLCARELAAGRAGATYEAFCGNAQTFDGLKGQGAAAVHV